MVDDVMEEEPPQSGDARHAEHDVRAALQCPRRRELGIASGDERAPDVGDVPVERLEHVGPRRFGRRRAGGAGQVVRLGAQDLACPNAAAAAR